MIQQRVRRSLLVATLGLSSFVARPHPSAACSCADGTPEFDAAFIGRVVAVIEGAWIRERLWLRNEGFGSTVALLNVEQVWQGPERRIAVVIGGTEQGDCLLHFLPGEKYLINVPADMDGPILTTTCIGSRQMPDSGA